MLTKENIITEIFGNKIDINDNEVNEKVILAPKNNDVININNDIISLMEGQCVEYISIDSAEDVNGENLDARLPIKF